jgi:hypothetical protein
MLPTAAAMASSAFSKPPAVSCLAVGALEISIFLDSSRTGLYLLEN